MVGCTSLLVLEYPAFEQTGSCMSDCSQAVCSHQWTDDQAREPRLKLDQKGIGDRHVVFLTIDPRKVLVSLGGMGKCDSHLGKIDSSMDRAAVL